MAVMPVVFFENQDGAGSVQNLAALASPPNGIYEVSGDEVRLPAEFNRIVGIYGGLDHTVEPRLRIKATSFKKQYGRTHLEVPFINSGAEPGSPPLFNDYRHDPIRLMKGDVLTCETLQNPGSATDQYVILWVSDGRLSPVSAQGGQWIRVTTTASAMTANAWNSRELPSANWDEVLDPGEYSVIHARGYSTSALAFTLENGKDVYHTPILAADAKADLVHPAFAKPGDWGELTRFHTDKMPTSRWLVDLADNEAQVVDLLVKRVGA